MRKTAEAAEENSEEDEQNTSNDNTGDCSACQSAIVVARSAVVHVAGPNLEDIRAVPSGCHVTYHYEILEYRKQLGHMDREINSVEYWGKYSNADERMYKSQMSLLYENLVQPYAVLTR